MEVGQECVKRLKLVSRSDEQVGGAFEGRKLPIGDGRLQGAHDGGPDGDDTVAGFLNLVECSRCGFGQSTPLGMHDVFIQLLGSNGAKCSEADVQGYVFEAEAVVAAVGQEILGKGEPRSGSRNGSGVTCENSLVSLPILVGCDISLDLGAQRNGPEMCQHYAGDTRRHEFSGPKDCKLQA